MHVGFAEKSPAEEWRTRAQDFAQRKLFRQEAKCYQMSGDREKELFAIAKATAHEASLIHADTDTDKRKQQFLDAACLFLKCETYDEAATCLRHAGEQRLLTLLRNRIEHQRFQ